MKYLFVYGTLKKGYSNNMLLRDTEFIEKSVTIDNFNIKSFGIPIVIKPVNTEMKKEAKPIIGEVYNIPQEVLDIVDLLEGHPDLYRRELTKVKLFETQEIVDAYVYFFQPDDYYYDLSNNDESVVVTEHGYEWVDIVTCWLCGEKIEVKWSDGRCPNCGTFARF